eukprot:1507585-Karenia_brevis.AAC.1
MDEDELVCKLLGPDGNLGIEKVQLHSLAYSIAEGGMHVLHLEGVTETHDPITSVAQRRARRVKTDPDDIDYLHDSMQDQRAHANKKSSQPSLENHGDPVAHYFALGDGISTGDNSYEPHVLDSVLEAVAPDLACDAEYAEL